MFLPFLCILMLEGALPAVTGSAIGVTLSSEPSVALQEPRIHVSRGLCQMTFSRASYIPWNTRIQEEGP